MNKLSLTLLIVLLALNLSAQVVTLMEENFEGVFPGELWELSGSPTWNDKSEDYHNGGWAGWCAGSDMEPSENMYADNMQAEMSWGPFALEDVQSASLSFWYKVNAELNYDTFKVGIYNQPGDQWVWNELLSTSATDGEDWVEANIDLSGYIGDRQLKIAFRFETDGSVNNLMGAWVDDIALRTDGSVVNKPSEPLSGDAYEPDNTPHQANTLVIRTLEQSQSHNLHNEHDEDWFRFRGELGKKFIFTSRSDFDPMVFVYEDDGSREIGQNDDGNSGEDSGLDFELEFTPAETAWYKLKVTGYNGATGTYELLYKMEPTEIREPDAFELNNDQTRAVLLSIGPEAQTMNLNFHFASDVDWFAFEAQANRVYEFKSTSSEGMDPLLQLLNSEGVEVIQADDSEEDNDFYLSWTSLEAGTYYLKISDYSKNLGTYTFSHSYTEIREDSLEPNNSKAEAKPLGVTNSDQGLDLSIHSNEDADWFRVELDSNQIYKFYSTGGMDIRAALFASDGETELLSDDDGGENQNFNLQFTGYAAGTYYLKVSGYEDRIGIYGLRYVSENSVGDQFEPNNTRAAATPLEIGSQASSQNHTVHFGRDEDWFRFEVEAGKSYHFSSTGSLDMKAELFVGEESESQTEDDDSGDENNFALNYVASQSGTAYLKVSPYSNSLTGNYQLQYYWETGDVDEYEPDNDARTATILIISNSQQRQSHTLHSPLDEDWFRFYLQTGKTYTFRSESELDIMAYLYSDRSDEAIAENDDNPNEEDYDFLLEFTPERSGFYNLKVKPYGNNYGEYLLIY